jgi:cytochrome c553
MMDAPWPDGRPWLTVLLAMALGAPAVASAQGDAAGRRLVTVGAVEHGVPACGSCHGLQGQGVAGQNGPRLAGQNEDYLAAQLDAFAAGARQNVVMGPIAVRLTSEQRARVAAYFAGLPPRTEPRPSARTNARGRAIAQQGDWSLQAPPCEACHGPGGVGVGATAPPLAGQTQAYLYGQLLRFRDGQRRGETLGLMNGVAARLSMADLQAAAAYFASLPFPASAPAVSGARP